MKHLPRFAIIMMLLAVLVIPAVAQEGEGGIIITSTFGSPPATFSQIYCTDTSCQDRILNNMYITPVGVNPETMTVEPNVPGGLAESWEISDDGLVYTVHLREDMFWSDGTPITSADVMLDWELMNNPEAAHPNSWVAGEVIANVEAPDEHTLVVTFPQASCDAANYIGYLLVLPSHILGDIPPADLADDPFSLNPTVTSGPFVFGEDRPGEFTSLIGNDDYVDAELGYVNPDGLIQVVVADQTVEIEKFLAGEINVLDFVPPNRKADIRAAAEDGSVQIYDYPGNLWDYIGLNTADPNNPQPALDENGNHPDQGYHPIFGDKLVRQALARAIDVDEIIAGAVFGEGDRMTAHITPSSWAYNNDLPPIPYDPEAAVTMLAEAGWVPENPDAPAGPDNPLVCQGCLYASEVDPAFEGSPFEFELITNAGNTRREAIGTIVQDQLSQIGITVDFQTIDFNTLLDVTDAQTYDAFILGWRASYPDIPDTTQIFGAAADVPGVGYNNTSFYNEEYFDLERQAQGVPGCATADRAPIYQRMQEIMQDEMPYIWLYSQGGMYVARSNVDGFGPWPANLWWNVDTWAVAEE